MNTSTIKKNKVVLADYNYQKDIQTRLLLSNLKVDTLDVLKEILDGSLKTSLSSLIETLEISRADLLHHLEQLKDTGLFNIQGETLLVDKEVRKYLEAQVVKFDPNFEAGMEFLQSLLAKVPMQAIPNWYALPRTSDHLFLSIIEKNMATPKIYQQYLDELTIDFPHAEQIGKELFNAPELALKAEDVMKKYGLSHAEFEECVLHLEYNLVGCLSYRQVGDSFEEHLIPFAEWQEYLTFCRDTRTPSIATPENVVRKYADDFGFLKIMSESFESLPRVPEKALDKMKLLYLVEESPTGIVASSRAEQWLMLPLQEKAAALYRHTLHEAGTNELFSDKDLRQVQKSLKRIAKSGWVYFDDFIKGFLRPLGNATAVALKNRGKKWRYARPVLQAHEKGFVYHSIFETFLEMGIVATGEHEGRPCFCVTGFGRLSLDE